MIIADLVQDQSTLAHLEARNDSTNGNGLVYLRRPARKIVAYVKNIIQFYFNPRHAGQQERGRGGGNKKLLGSPATCHRLTQYFSLKIISKHYI
jgi:hypothetical protein